MTAKNGNYLILDKTIIIKRFFLLSVLILFPLIVNAWNANGHMVIAHIAYQQLTPTARQQVDKLVSYLNQEYPSIHNFEQFSCWPDAIRAQKIETFTHWHYIDIAFSTDGSPLKNLINTDNGVWALRNIQKVVKNEKANDYDRARFLAFLVHIVSDLHQPLHTVTNITVNHPEGDQGGNLFFIRYNNQRMNLHHIWDSGVGLFAFSEEHADNMNSNKDVASIYRLASRLSSQYPKIYFNHTMELDPEEWVREGRVNATKYVYTITEEQALSTNYLEIGKQIAGQQATLAGYRLGAWLNTLLN